MKNSFECYGMYPGDERGARVLAKSSSDLASQVRCCEATEPSTMSTQSSYQLTFGGPLTTPVGSYSYNPRQPQTYQTQSSHQLTFDGGDDLLFAPLSEGHSFNSSWPSRHSLPEGPTRARSFSLSGSPVAPPALSTGGIRSRGVTQESAPPVVVVPRQPPTPRGRRRSLCQPVSHMRRLALLVLAAAAFAASAGLVRHFGADLGSGFSRPASDTPASASAVSAEQRLMDWAAAQGAQLRVTIGHNAEGVRGLFTSEDIAQGDVLIDIPDHIIFSFRNAPAAETAPHLLKEVHAASSRLEPYLDVLPKSDEVLTGYNWPEEYIPYLASDALEQQVQRTFKRYAQDVWSGQLNENLDMTLREAVGSGGVSLEDFQHAVAVITSRTMQTRAGSLSLVPIADLANHHPAAAGHVVGSATKNRNFQFVAGRNFKKGEEVLVTYGNLRNDDLLLYYGFVDETTQPPMLCSCDHRDFVLFETASETLGPDEWSGTYEEMEAEIDRLKTVLHVLQRRLQELGPIPQTAPHVANVLTAFHRLRKDALLNEIRRLTYPTLHQ